MTSIKCMIFDLGNVVAYFDHYVACQKFADWSSFDGKKIYELIFAKDKLNEQFEAGEMNTEEFLKELRNLLSLKSEVSDDELKQAWNEIFRPNRDVTERLPHFKQDCRLILASNTNPLHIEHVRAHPKFKDSLSIFDRMVLSYEVGFRKPDKRFFERCVQLAKCDAGDCLYLDDMPEHVTAARAAGMQSFQYVKSLDASLGGSLS